MRISDWSSDVCSSDLVRDGVDYLVVDVPGELEAAGDLRVLEVATEAHDRRDLAGDVTVLAPSADLVVAHLRDAGREGGGLGVLVDLALEAVGRSEEHKSELQSLMRLSYAVFCLKKKKMNRYI